MEKVVQEHLVYLETPYSTLVCDESCAAHLRCVGVDVLGGFCCALVLPQVNLEADASAGCLRGLTGDEHMLVVFLQ